MDDTEGLASLLDYHRQRIEDQIGQFSYRPMSRKERDRRRPALLITDESGDEYEASFARDGEPQFIPGVAIRVLIKTYLGAP